MTIKVNVTDAPDIAILSQLHKAGFPQGWSEGDIDGLLASGAVAFVADGGAAFGLVRKAADEGEILTLTVAEAQRRMGIAKAMVSAMCEWARSNGVRTLFLDVRQSNQGAIALYEKAGFKPTGLRKQYYGNLDGSREDAVLMRRVL